MANVVRWNPFREMMSLRDEMDRLYEEAFGMPMRYSSGKSGSQGFALDISEGEDQYTISAELPGMDPENINIEFNNGVLSISAESSFQNEDQNERYYMRERRYGRFSRSVSLPQGISASDITADYNNGILKIAVPKSEDIKPRRINVSSSGDNNQEDGRSGQEIDVDNNG